jgi:purine-nucleoside phosphorylase
MQIPTPHITAKAGDFGKTVLMPGDPLRAKFIAETFFENPVLVNTVRGVNGYTGTYKGVKVSVMASGMGIPSIGIYSYELFSAYGVENILRVGTAGAIHKELPVRSLVFGMGACTNSNFASQYNLPGTFAPIASYDLLREGVKIAEAKEGVNYKVGNILSSDTFYDDAQSGLDWQKMGVLAVEMEAAGLYMTASRLGKNAMALCTISDNLVTGEVTTAEERQNTFTSMMEIALDLAVDLDKN